MSAFEKRIEEILGNVYATGHNQLRAAQAYSESFQHEGLRKAQFAINRINELDHETQELLKDFTALSVGGADGSDLLALIKNTPIRRAILLEYDNDAAKLANENTKPLIEAEGAVFQVIIGDAVQQLENVVKLLKAEQVRQTGGLLCVFFGVLHELPRRSPGFDLRHYISRLASVFDRNLFFLSEPYLPTHGEEEVEVRISSINEDRLFELMRHINAHLFDNGQPLLKLSAGFVRSGFALVMETLHKLLRFETIPRLRHEMGERLTEFTSNQFLQAFQITLPHAFVERTERVSEGFMHAYRSAEVEMRTKSGQRLTWPFSHVRMSVISFPPQEVPPDNKAQQHTGNQRLAGGTALPLQFQYAASSLADVDFPLPSGHPITEIVLDLRSYDWYRQRPAIDKIFTDINWPERTPDEAFVLGRNIYQCAVGKEKRAIAIMDDLRRELAKIPDDWNAHMLNGMFYEAYFDHEGQFREGDLKDKYLGNLFALETSSKYAGSIEFIHASLEPYRSYLGVLPNATPERLEVNVALNTDVDPPVITSIKCRGAEQIIPAKNSQSDPAWELSYRPVSVEEFGDKLAEFWSIPKGRLAVSFDIDVESQKIQFVEGSTVQPLRM